MASGVFSVVFLYAGGQPSQMQMIPLLTPLSLLKPVREHNRWSSTVPVSRHEGEQGAPLWSNWALSSDLPHLFGVVKSLAKSVCAAKWHNRPCGTLTGGQKGWFKTNRNKTPCYLTVVIKAHKVNFNCHFLTEFLFILNQHLWEGRQTVNDAH